MWLTSRDQNNSGLILTYNKPYIWELHDGEKYYDLCHSVVHINKHFFPYITFEQGPIEVELYRTNDVPMVWLQRHKNRDGSVDLYYDSKLHHYRKPIKVYTKKWWEFWKPKYWNRAIMSDVITEVDTYGGTRLPRKSFPEVTMEDGYVGYGIRIKGKEVDGIQS